MSARPAMGRVRGYHSFSKAVSIGLLLAAVAFVIFVLCGGARAAAVCMPWADLKPRVAKAWHEFPIDVGVINAQTVVEIMASPDGATFTVVIVDAAGRACAILSGTGWEGVEPTKSGTPG